MEEEEEEEGGEGKVKGFLFIAANQLRQETVAEKEREWVFQKKYLTGKKEKQKNIKLIIIYNIINNNIHTYMQKEEFGYPFHATIINLNIPYFIPSVINTHDI